MGYAANRRKVLNTSTLSYAEKRRKELGAKTNSNQIDATVQKTDAREVMAKKQAGVTTGKLTAKKDDNKLTLGKVAVKRIPAALTNRESQQAIRQPIWNAIDKAAAFNDVQGTEMRKYAFGDTRPYDEGYAPTTGNETADTIARNSRNDFLCVSSFRWWRSVNVRCLLEMRLNMRRTRIIPQSWETLWVE